MKKMYLALLLLSMQSFIFAQPWEWQWQNAKPVGNALYDVHALSSTRIIAFGTGSTVLISTDAGETWQVSYPDASRREIWGSYFLNSTTGFMVGGTTAIGSLLMKTTDGGNTWVAKTPGTTNILYDIEFYDANNGIACGAAGTVIRTTDGGDTWTAIASLGAGTIYKVSIVNSAVVYIGCSNMAGYLFKSTNFGATFSNVTPAQITSSVYGMYVGSASNIWATTSSNGIVATTDGGTTWTVQQVDANTVYDIKFYNSTNGFAVDSKGIIWTTTNSGTNWAQTQLGTINPLRQMDISTSNLILVGDGGAIFKSTTSGSSWAAKFTTAAQQQFRKIIFKGDNNGWAGECPTSGNSKLIYTTDGGQNWATRYTFPNPIYSMSMPTNTTWYIGSASNTIYKTTDGGDSFTTLTQPLTGETFWFIGFADSLNGYAGGSAGKIIKTTDGGSSWTDLSTAAGFTTNQIYEIAVIDAQTIYLSGGGARLAKTTNGGTSFTAQSTGLAGTFFTVKFKDATTGFVGSANLGVSKTTNSGASWTVETLPTNPPASNASIWGFAFSGSTVWASTVNGDILYSTDSGTTWTVAKRPSSQVTYNFAVSNNNLWGAGGQGNIIKGYANPNTVSLNLTALIEALYVAGGTSMPITPDVTVELHSATSPYTLVESKTGTLSTAGVGTFSFGTAVNGTNYYVVVKSINTVETWSATAVSFTSNALSYDFTTALNKAYTDGSADPMSLHGGKYCIYSGDLNQDGFVSGDDMTGIDNDNTNFDYHAVNDLNGDGFISGDDMTFVDNNNTNFIGKQVPPGAPNQLTKRVKSPVQQKISVK